MPFHMAATTALAIGVAGACALAIKAPAGLGLLAKLHDPLR